MQYADAYKFASIGSTSGLISSSGCLTILENLTQAKSRLHENGIETPRLDAEVLLAYVLDCERVDLYTNPNQPVSDRHKRRFDELLKQRVQRAPVKYLTARCEFMSLEFEVNREVLIPRPETELVVEAALGRIQAMDDSLASRRDALVGDIGTGSGDIAVAIAVYSKRSRVYASDISRAALGVAQRNAEKHGVSDRVVFLKGDLFEVFDDCNLPQELDIVVSNPPYVSESEWRELAPEIRNYEPPSALIAGRDGLDYFRRIVIEAPSFLRPGGWLILEIGAGQRAAVAQLIEDQRAFETIEVTPDYNGIERVVAAQKER